MNALIILSVNPDVLKELIECEYGSYEDAGANDKSVDVDTGSTHVVNIFKRHTHCIIINDETEARTVYLAVCSGTFQQQCRHHLRIAEGICDHLRKFCTPEELRLWPYPSGV